MKTNNHGGEIIKADHKVLDFVVGHQKIDWVVAIILCLLLGWHAIKNGALVSLDPIGRRAVYQTLTGLAGTLLGLTMTTISVLSSNIDKAIGGSPRGLPRGLVNAVSEKMFGLIFSLGITLLITLTALVIDTRTPTGLWFVQPILVTATAIVSIRLTRVLILMFYWLKARVAPE